MSNDEKPLPEPRMRAFGKRRFEEEGQPELLADRLALAMAGGNLEELIRNEIPDSEYSGKLVSLMMGMTGMAPLEGTGSQNPKSPEAPEGLMDAIGKGDTGEIAAILKREHEKRFSDPAHTPQEETKEPAASSPLEDREKEVIDRLLKIAEENNVSIDWIISRALKLYIREYDRTGRL